MWYDYFSYFYDRALEDLYAPFREQAADALHLQPGSVVLDLPCGTGQSLDSLVTRVGPEGRVLGVDASAGMLKRAQQRVSCHEWPHVALARANASHVNREFLQHTFDSPQVDAILCALGLSAFENWEQTLDTLMSCLRPGGRFVIFDVFASTRTFQTRSVELLARADLSRELWPALGAYCDDVTRTVLDADPKDFGGELYVAAGTRKPTRQGN